MRKAYLAAPYGRRAEIVKHMNDLQIRNIEVTSQWLHLYHEAEKNFGLKPGTNQPAAPMATVSAEEATQFALRQPRQFAQDDLDDIDACDTIISFTEPPDSKTPPRGGRHVEYGYALAKHKELWVVGYRENIFHTLPQVMFFQNWDELLDHLDFDTLPHGS